MLGGQRRAERVTIERATGGRLQSALMPKMSSVDAAALQVGLVGFVGFRSVLVRLWSVSDNLCHN